MEVADLADTGQVGIRESKQGDRPVLAGPTAQFAAFIAYARTHHNA